MYFYTIFRFVNQLTKQQRKQLRKHIRPLKVLESKKVSLKRKQKILTNQWGKGLLTDIWKAVKGIFNIWINIMVNYCIMKLVPFDYDYKYTQISKFDKNLEERDSILE